MTSTLAKITFLSLLFLLFSPHLIVAETKTYIKEYNYQASEDDSRNSSRVSAMREVKRLLLEELGTYLESVTEVKNFQLTKDQITALTAGIVKTEMLDEKWDGHTYWIKTKIVADPDDVVKSIAILRKDRSKSKELDDIKKRSDEILEENKRLREELHLAKGEDKQKIQKRYDTSIKQLSAIEWFENGYRSVDHKAAIHDYSKAIELNPKFVEAYINRAWHYEKVGNNNEAIADCSKAIELNPNFAIAYSNRGNSYLSLGKYAEAIADFSKAIELNPNYATAYVDRGIAHKHLRKYREAFIDFDKAVQIDPKLANAYNGRGLIYMNLGKYNEAILDYDKAVQIDPKLANAYSNRGTNYLYLGKYTEAIADFNKAIEMNPKDADAYSYSQRGIAYVYLGKYNEAFIDYNRAIELNPKDADAYFNRACAYSLIGNRDRAMQDLSTSIKMKSELRNNAKTEKDFDNIRNIPEFKRLIGE